MNAQVVCISSHEPTQPYYHWREYKESLRRFAEVPTNIGEGREWRGLHTKPYLLREWLRQGRNTSDRLIITDAWDIVFTKHPHGIGDECAHLFGDAIVFNGEKGCWPREDLREAFPQTGSAWAYLNSGFFCGPADKILALLEVMDIDGIGFDRRNEDDTGWIFPNDQGTYQDLYARQSEHGIRMVVDTQCVVAQTLSACEMDEFDFSGPHIRNKATGTEPGVFHLNGGAKEIFGPSIYAKYNLP